MQLYKNFCKEKLDENGNLLDFELEFPENYNFGYDVVDKMAELAPDDIAVVWTNPDKEERTFTFADISRLSNKAANVFRNNGIKKGDKVLVILKRNYEYWYVAPALHKLGAIIILQLTFLRRVTFPIVLTPPTSQRLSALPTKQLPRI